MDRDPKIQSAYTEQEAKDEVVEAARFLAQNSQSNSAWRGLRSALILVDTYKGVK